MVKSVTVLVGQRLVQQERAIDAQRVSAAKSICTSVRVILALNVTSACVRASMAEITSRTSARARSNF